MRNVFKISLVLFIAVSMTNCSDTEFKGNKSQREATQVNQPSVGNPGLGTTPLGPQITNNPTTTPTLDQCIDGIVDVQVLSQSLQAGPALTAWAPTKTLTFGLSLKCQGERVPLTGLSIAADINASVDPFETPLNYQVASTNGQTLSQGVVNSVSGSDLFGNTGSYAYWQTDTLNIATTETYVIFRIDLSEITITEPENNPAGPGMIQAFCRIGPVVSGAINIQLVP